MGSAPEGVRSRPGRPGGVSWDRKHLEHSRLVARTDRRILGWAALSPVSDRCAYAGVAVVSVYVAALARGRGLGGNLLAALIASSERSGIWTLQAGIFPENRESVAIHLKNGFREVGRRERLGKLAGEWRDVLMLERRSRIVGG